MKNSLSKKYILAGILITIGFLVLLFLTSRLLKKSMVEYWNRKDMEEVANVLIEMLDETDWDVEEIDLESIAFDNNLSISIADEELQILATTRARIANRGTLGDKTLQTIQERKQEMQEKGKIFFSSFEEKAYFSQINKVDGHGYILLSKLISGLNSSMRIIEIAFVFSACIVLLAGIPVIVLLSERMVRPIKKINQVTKQIAQLNFEETLPVYSSDELGTLAESVNIMSDKLKETMESLKKDIELRETLVRNMAHELKTPIAVIMGYAENMSYIAESHPEKLEQYCMVIVNESERMNGMIRQMLEVSAGTQGKMELNISEFSAEDFLEDIRRRYEDEFCTREGSYQSFNEITTKIHGDYQVLMQALYNYIKNAVRYGKKDGLIHVRAWEEEKYFSFAVFNQGDPVPEEEQEKIWNVFYKINPARTREEKSFGIGLSIVRQAAVAHGGKTGVKNVNDGVEFLLQIKK